MEDESYSEPAHNLGCRYRFTCGAVKCPAIEFTSKPPCYVDKFKRYQPEPQNPWHRKSWEEANRITWREVFSLQESWIYALLLITIIAFIFLSIILIYVLLKTNRYY